MRPAISLAALFAAMLLTTIAPAQTTQPAAPQEADSPKAVMQRFMDLLARGDVQAAKALTIPTPPGVDNDSSVDAKLQGVADTMAGGVVKADIIDARQDGDLAYLIVRATGLGDRAGFSAGPLMRRNGAWRVVMYNPEDGADAATAEKVKALKAWSRQRMTELRAAASQPSTQPAR